MFVLLLVEVCVGVVVVVDVIDGRYGDVMCVVIIICVDVYVCGRVVFVVVVVVVVVYLYVCMCCCVW